MNYRSKQNVGDVLHTFTVKGFKNYVLNVSGFRKIKTAIALLYQYSDSNAYKYNYNFPLRILVCVPTMRQVRIWKDVISKAISDMDTPCIIDIETKNSLRGKCAKYHIAIYDHPQRTGSNPKAVADFIQYDNLIAFA